MAGKGDGKRQTLLTAEQILGADDREERVIEVPEWGGSVRVRAFSKAEEHRMRKLAMVKNEVDTCRMQMLMVITGMVQPKLSLDQIEALSHKSQAAIDRILLVLMDISGMKREAVDDAKRNFPEEPGLGVRVCPGGEAGADGFGDAVADVDG